MKATRRNDPAPASVRTAPPLIFQRRFKATTVTAADPRNRAPATEAQALGFQRDMQWSPPHREVRTPAKHTNGNLRLQRAVERLYRLGPRPIMELLIEIADGADLDTALATYARLDPDLVRALNGDRFPMAPIHEVQDGLTERQP